MISQFDVFENPVKRAIKAVPFVIVLQSGFVFDTAGVVVASLTSRAQETALTRLSPAFSVAGRSVVLTVTDMATIRRSALDAFVTNLTHERQRIIAALDILFTGF